MNSFRMLKLSLIVVGFGAALLFSPACKAQEVSPDHFTDTGVQDVYEPATAKPAPKAKAVHVAANRTSASSRQPAAAVVADKRKPPVLAASNKQ